MRIVVISDSHRRSGNIKKILDAQQSARHIFFLGDVTGDIEDLIRLYPDKTFHIVSGNCDCFSSYPSSDIANIAGHGIFLPTGIPWVLNTDGKTYFRRSRRRLRYCALRAHPCFKGII